MTPAPDAIFHPSPERTLALLNELLDPALPLREVAERHNTSVAALSLWLGSPHAADLFAPRQSGLTTRIHLIAAAHLAPAVAAISEILNHFNQSHADPDQSKEERTRARLHALRAAALMVRLSTYRPRAAHAAPIATYTPGVSESFGGASESRGLTRGLQTGFPSRSPLARPIPHPPTPAVPAPAPVSGPAPAGVATPSTPTPSATRLAKPSPPPTAPAPRPAPSTPSAPSFVSAPAAAQPTPTPDSAPSHSPPPLPSDPAIDLARAHLRTHFPAFSEQELESILAEAIATFPTEPEPELAGVGSG